jgi:hypothetical protein
MNTDRAGYLELAEEVFGYVEDEEPEPSLSGTKTV